MTPSSALQTRLRRYLLGQLIDEAREEIEKDFLTSGELFEELLVAEDELIDDYLSEDLGTVDRAAFENHFLSTSERHDQLRFGRAFNRYLTSQSPAAAAEAKPFPLPANRSSPFRVWSPWTWIPTFFSSPLRMAVAAVIVIGVALGVWRVFFHQSEVDRGLLALNAAYKDQRPIESRISALSYAPFVQTRGGPDSQRVDRRARDRAELILNTAASDPRDAAAHHALGEVYLAAKRFDEAITEFDLALKSDPQNAKLYSDLGAAWLEKGNLDQEKARANPKDEIGGKAVSELAKAFEYVNDALVQDPNLLEALFNRALYHRRMRLSELEEADWREYLKRDSSSQWAAEARTRLQFLEEERKQLSESKEEKLERFRMRFRTGDDSGAWELISSYQNRGGNLIVEQLLDNYLSAEARGASEEAKQELSSLVYIGNLSRARIGDPFFSDLVQYYARLQPNQKEQIAQARTLMKSGHKGWGEAKVQESLETFTHAEQLFEQVGDQFESIVADYWISFCYYRLNNQPAGLAVLEPLLLRTENNRYLWVLSRLFYLKSLIHFKLNELSKAIDFANRSGELARQTNDKVGLINALDSLMEYRRNLGDHQNALSCIQQGFGIVDSIALDPVQATRHYGLVAIAFASADLFAASADSQKLALEFALQSGRSAAISANYSFLGLTQWKLGDYHEALRNSQLAYDTAHAHAGGSDDQNLMAYASLQMANAARLAGDLNSAIANYTRSIEIYTALSLPTHLYQAHKGRLLCYLALKNDARAKDDISTAIELVENYRNQVFEENTRERFFDTEQNVYDTAIDFEYSHKNVDQAFQYSENSRGRALLDLINRDTQEVKTDRDLTLVFESLARPLNLSEIRSRLPPQVQVAQYAVLEDKLLIWLISRDGGVEAFSRTISARELTEKVRAYLISISKRPGLDEPGDETAAGELYDILIGPLASRLDSRRQLCIVPDKVLSLLPFAALKSPAGRYLIQDYVLQTSPSSTVFIACSEIAKQKEIHSDETVLSVGNPTFDRTENPQLLDLPDAAREAKQVAKLYASPNLLTENDATAAAFRAAIGKSDVIHLALHSVLDEQFPLRSKLLFAKAKSPADEILSASDIYLMELSRARLVVLSACQTGAEQYYKGEGAISLARPFIAARVPLVVASMWPVESGSTAELMISFHQNRAQKISTAQALAEAQRAMLLAQDSRYHQPHYWAPFMVIGGYAKF